MQTTTPHAGRGPAVECAIEGCGRTLAPKAQSPFCSRCRSGLSYWRPKRPAERLAYRGKLAMLTHRIAELT